MKSFFVTAAALLAVGAFGCAVDTSSTEASKEGTAESNEALKRAPIVNEFEHCGGNIRHAPKCAEGLKCQLTVSRPDTGGICVQADVGSTCGGNTVGAHTCDAGLKCVLGSVSMPDLGGTCQYASEGETCGGNMMGAVHCGPSLLCKTSNPDVGGVCVAVSQAGGPCGGFKLDAPVCAQGLTCVLTPSRPDMPGTCQ